MHLVVVLLLLCDLANVVSGSSCSSSASCPAHESEDTKTCYLKGYSHFWGFDTSSFFKFDFPGKGMYTFVKSQKDTTDCCFDVEIQGFMCDVLKGGEVVRAHRTSHRLQGHDCVRQDSSPRAPPRRSTV